jgi:beta-galactosidase
VEPVRATAPGVEAALRRGPDADYLFLINHTDQDTEVAVSADATELLTGTPVPGPVVTVAAGEVAVVREPRGA